MKTKEEILQGIAPNYSGKGLYTQDECFQSMDEYAQSLAKEVVEELKNGLQPNNIEQNKGIYYAINLVKTKYSI